MFTEYLFTKEFFLLLFSFAKRKKKKKEVEFSFIIFINIMRKSIKLKTLPNAPIGLQFLLKQTVGGEGRMEGRIRALGND